MIISQETLDRYGVVVTDGSIVFPYNGLNGKFSAEAKMIGNEREQNHTQDKLKEPHILFGMDTCTKKDQPLFIFQSEIDCLAGSEIGIDNAVGMPNRRKEFAWVQSCWPFLEQFKEIRIIANNDERGQRMIEFLKNRLDNHILAIAKAEPTVYDLLAKKGQEAVLILCMMAQEVPPFGLLDLADVNPVDIKTIPKVKSGFSALDRAIGGFLYGDLSVWTGRRGEGKSTLISQIAAEAVDAGKRVCIYSGELPADRFQYWFNLQLAGPEYVKSYAGDGGKPVFFVPDETTGMIRGWYRGKVKIYDNSIAHSGEAESILKAFDEAARRYDCKIFIVDNLMTAQFGGVDYYRAQSNFVGQLVAFAQKHKAHVHLVAHPRKSGDRLQNDDVSGSGDITNRASNVFSLERLDEDDRDAQGCDAVLTILKNRWDGARGTIGLDFDAETKRYYQPRVGNVKHFGWEPNQMRVIEEESPFED